MRILKFEGATMRDAIAKVKAELGDQAVIISTRQVRRGLLGSAVEISAAIEDGEPEAAAALSGPTGNLAPRAEDVEKLIAPLRTELRSLRAMVRTSGDSRGTTEIKSEIAALRKLVEELAKPSRAAEPAPRVAEDAPLTAPSTSRILMLVGPTGAGKTTTIAKLAARAALIEHKRVGVVTLDNYRVGGIEQIRTFCDLIGVPLQVAETPAALPDLIDPADELTLIDTAGRSPRDIAAIAELAESVAGIGGVEVHLVVPAATTAPLIDELVQRYRALAPARLLFTKLDEIERAPELALAPVRTKLPITWVTTGQAVPEDIEEPAAPRVLELASHGLVAPQSTRNRGRKVA